MNRINFSSVALTIFGTTLFALLISIVPLTNLPAQAPLKLQIAFVSYRDGNWEIYAMDEEGGNLRNLTNRPGSDRNPAWSPDGQQIAFQRGRDVHEEGGGVDIYVMNAEDRMFADSQIFRLAIVKLHGPLMLSRLPTYLIEAEI